MHTAPKAGAVVTALCLLPLVANHPAEAGKEEGVGIGAGLGAIVAGPVGAVVGGVIGYKTGGPDIIPRERRYTCWRDDDGRRKCRRVRR